LKGKNSERIAICEKFYEEEQRCKNSREYCLEADNDNNDNDDNDDEEEACNSGSDSDKHIRHTTGV